jgi:hypothetical protein
MANDCIKFKEEGDHITCKADGAAVVGKTFVDISGAKTSTLLTSGQGSGLVSDASSDKSNVYKAKTIAGSAGKRCLGVAAFDAASGALFTVIREGIVPITCAASITAGVEVEIDAAGKVIPLNMGVAVGKAMNTQTTVGGDAEILLYK